MVEIISRECVDLLPLSPEPIASWNTNSDLRSLLKEMYALSGHSSYGDYLADEDLKRWNRTRIDFQRDANNATPPPS